MELKPCPFCGGRPEIVQSGHGTEGNSVQIYFRISCRKCGATSAKPNGRIAINLNFAGELNVWHDDREECEKEWNRRDCV